jgi:hypothetical protein
MWGHEVMATLCAARNVQRARRPSFVHVKKKLGTNAKNIIIDRLSKVLLFMGTNIISLCHGYGLHCTQRKTVASSS